MTGVNINELFYDAASQIVKLKPQVTSVGGGSNLANTRATSANSLTSSNQPA